MMTQGCRIISLALLIGCSAWTVSAQVPPPRRESRWSRIFTTHRDSDNLEQRVDDLSCALLVLQSGDRLGTGFFINGEGDVVTASHVLGDRTFQREGQQMRITITPAQQIIVRTHDSQFMVPATSIENDADQWSADLAVLRTGHHSTCWLQIGDDERVRSGQHIIALGFPGLAFGSLALYTGIISARLRSGLVIGRTVQGEPLTGNNDVFRVQMPISPGISGAPVIDDENRAIAVVTAAGAWSDLLEALTQLSRRGLMPVPAPNTVDLPLAIAQLATLFHDYASPGYGDAVPLNYLRRTAVPPSRSPEAHGH
jgi:S1-C subfamily serine protease